MTAYIPGTNQAIATWDKLETSTNHFTGLHIGSYYKSLFSGQKVKLIDAKTKLFSGIIQTTVKLDAGDFGEIEMPRWHFNLFYELCLIDAEKNTNVL